MVTPADTQQADEPVCACGLNLNIWQSSWNHRPGCLMEPVARPSADTEVLQADAWDQGYKAGHSRAMSLMSDEPLVAHAKNPHRAEPDGSPVSGTGTPPTVRDRPAAIPTTGEPS